MPFIACRLCDKIKAVYKYYTGAKTMERQRFLPLLAVIIFIWVLWRYEAALALLGFFCNLIMPFIIGGCLAFFVFVLLLHYQRLLKKVFAGFS